MRINLCQIDTKTLDINANSQKIQDIISSQSEDTINVFPELTLSGSPLFRQSSNLDINKLCSLSGDKLCQSQKSFIIGTPAKNDDVFYNSMVFVYKGQVKAISTKRCIDKYDEGFAIGNGLEVITLGQERIAFGFKDDINNFVLRKVKVDCIIVVGNELFDKNDKGQLVNELSIIARKTDTPIVYLNRIGAEGSLVYTGESFVLNNKGEICVKLSISKQEEYFFDTTKLKTQYQKAISFEQRIYESILIGIKDYFQKTGIKKAIIGLSGGIDSALVVALAVRALGKENVIGILMPSDFSSIGSIEDAKQSANNLGIEYHIVPIKSMFESAKESLNNLFVDNNYGLTQENLQARIRLIIVMAYCNKYHAAMLNTSNKSESTVGYGTIYGDDSGAIGPIGDLYKTEVYRLAKWLNRDSELIPWNSINKEPSAELHLDQKDSDSIPDYDTLDKIATLYIDSHLTKEEIIAKGYTVKDVEQILHLFKINEFKRRQEAPALRLSNTCFTTDYKIPIV